MSGKYEHLKKEIPIHGRKGILRLGAELERDLFGWDSFCMRYGLVDGEGMIPEETDRLHVHDYDQVLWLLSADAGDMLHLGAEVEVDLGEKVVRHRMATPHVILIPRGLPHFSPIVRKLDRPFFFVSVNLTGKMAATVQDEGAQPESGPWSRFFGEFSANVRALSFAANEPYHYGSERAQPSGGVSVFLDAAGAGIPLTMAWSTVLQDHNLGPWGEDGKHHPHVHEDYDEALIFLSMDPDNLTDLHCKADYCTGKDGEDQEHTILTKATVMAMEKGTWHLPLVYREVTGPSVFITCSSHPAPAQNPVAPKEKG